MAYQAYGTILQLSDGGGTPVYSSIAEIRTIGDIGGERDMIDVTNMDSLGQFKEFLSGLFDGLIVSLELNYLVQNATHKDMLTNLQQQTLANIWRAYRVVLPDFGNTSFTGTVVAATDVWTASATHGWNTAQPIQFTTTGALPTSSPQIVAGRIYWARRASTTTFKVYPTAADAVADTNVIDFTTTGSGTHTVKGGSVYAIPSAAFKSAKVMGPVADALRIQTSLKVRGMNTPPA